VNFKIKKLSDIGGFQWPEVREKKEVRINRFFKFFFQCVAKNIEG
jgi:hypothetical protein